jgi:hypothetical protein
VIVAWEDERAGPASDIYAQRLDSSGVVRWAAEGVPVGAGPGSQLLPGIISDGRGGAIVTWSDSRRAEEMGTGSVDLYAQRVDSSGNPQWAGNGILVADDVGVGLRPAAVTDGREGVIVAWESGAIYVQRVDKSGRPSWGDQGIELSRSVGGLPVVVTDGSGGVIVAWQDAGAEREDPDLFAQRVSASGLPIWTAGGVPVCASAGPKSEVAAAPDGAGGVFLGWRDGRSDNFGDIFAQRVGPDGRHRWAEDGVVVSTAPGFQKSLALCRDARGGIVLVWSDGRDGQHLYAERIDGLGRLGGPAAARPASSTGQSDWPVSPPAEAEPGKKP